MIQPVLFKPNQCCLNMIERPSLGLPFGGDQGLVEKRDTFCANVVATPGFCGKWSTKVCFPNAGHAAVAHHPYAFVAVWLSCFASFGAHGQYYKEGSCRSVRSFKRFQIYAYPFPLDYFGDNPCKAALLYNRGEKRTARLMLLQPGAAPNSNQFMWSSSRILKGAPLNAHLCTNKNAPILRGCLSVSHI